MNRKILSIEDQFDIAKDIAKNKQDTARTTSTAAIALVGYELEKLVAHIDLPEIVINKAEQQIRISINVMGRYWKKPAKNSAFNATCNNMERHKQKEDPNYQPNYKFVPESQFETYLIDFDQENASKKFYQVSGTSRGTKKKLKMFDESDDCLSFLVEELAGWNSKIMLWKSE
jgi:hypothetical protein